MKLTSEQQQAVAAWVAAGATMNEIQDRLKSDFGIVLTFMDTRFLLADLGLSLRPPPEEAEPAVNPADAVEADVVEEGLLEEEEGAYPAAPEAVADPSGGAPATVQVTVDAVTLPGTMVSGKVTFSDGVRGGWYLDSVGQLGLTGIPRTYQPPEADVVAFQRELQRALR